MTAGTGAEGSVTARHQQSGRHLTAPARKAMFPEHGGVAVPVRTDQNPHKTRELHLALPGRDHTSRRASVSNRCCAFIAYRSVASYFLIDRLPPSGGYRILRVRFHWRH